MVVFLNFFSLSPMTTRPTFTPEVYQYPTQYQKLLFIQSRCVFIFFLNVHPLCAKQDVYQPTTNTHSSIILYPHAHHTWRPQYVIAFLYAVSSASLLSSPSNFLPPQIFHGALSEIPTTKTHSSCISYIHTVVALYI